MTYQEIIDSIRAWALKHGRPPTSGDWLEADEGRLTSKRIGVRFGWGNMIEAAGFPRPLPGGISKGAPRTATDGDDKPFPMSGDESKKFGAIVTFENSAGKRLVLHRLGGTKKAIAAACVDALRLDETFKVVCFSTPTSVYRDLQGDRIVTGNRDGSFIGTYLALPENNDNLVPRELQHLSIRAQATKR